METPDPLSAASRLRREAGFPRDLPLLPERVLPRLYSVDCVVLSGLAVSAIRNWLAGQGVSPPAPLATCGDRRLRGGVIAYAGYGFLFADRDDPEGEQRFTLAHEAGHFLMDHLYPREDLLQRFGESLRDVLDGRRPATLGEEIELLLGRSTLTRHTHLLERDSGWGSPSSPVQASEAAADDFACELLAPCGLEQFGLLNREADLVVVLIREFGLPPRPAADHARRLLRRRHAPTRMRRLGLA